MVSVTDSLWYSASTITTSGGGGYYPNHWVGQLLSFYEVACGVILLVVCFTIYTGLLGRSDQNGRAKERGDS